MAELTVPSFACPHCHGPLLDQRCDRCGESFPLVDGVAVFRPGDDFYESKWLRTDESAGSPRNWLVKKERFFVRHLKGQRGTVLDLGCAGGWRLYTTVGPVVGVDLSLGSLKQARSLYNAVARADVTELPFADDSFDFVVSSDFLGHLPLEVKDRALREIWRVLKPGGRTIHYIEADSQDPLMRFARRWPTLYDRYIIQPDGHIGLELPEATFGRFRKFGFRPVVEDEAYLGLTYVGRVVKYFDNEYAGLSRRLGALVGVCKALTAHRALEMGANLAVSGLIEVGDRVLPTRWAGGVMVCYEK